MLTIQLVAFCITIAGILLLVYLHSIRYENQIWLEFVTTKYQRHLIVHGDDIEHELTTTCPCGPTVNPEPFRDKGYMDVFHHAVFNRNVLGSKKK